MDWCKLIQSIESALDVRDGLSVLKTRADAAMAVDGGMTDEGFMNQTLLARLLGKLTPQPRERRRCVITQQRLMFYCWRWNRIRAVFNVSKAASAYIAERVKASPKQYPQIEMYLPHLKDLLPRALECFVGTVS